MRFWSLRRLARALKAVEGALALLICQCHLYGVALLIKTDLQTLSLPPRDLESARASLPAPSVATLAAKWTAPDFRLGVSYSPYDANLRCRSDAAIAQDIDFLITTGGYDIIRTYGADVRGVLNALEAKWPDTRLFAGVWNLSNASGETGWLIEQVGGRWDRVHTVSIGNEVVNLGCASVETVLGALAAARAQLRAAGYAGPVVTVDTMSALQAHPALCGASDYCAFNCHAFFDAGSPARNAGSWVRGWRDALAAVAGGKALVVAETGWPTRGNPNGVALPSWEDHSQAIESIKSTLQGNVILFSGFNTHWHRDDASTFQTEQWWGIHGDAPSGP